MKIRQPIVTVAGHVDHGKTSILDCFRSSSIQEGEAGGITQKISFTRYPAEQIFKTCNMPKSEQEKVEIPGFLFIDTPGHAAFTNLRKRGGSLADLAILVVSIKEGIKPQTAEVIKILRENKTPFIIALNKVDTISGFPQNKPIKEALSNLPVNVDQEFQQALLTFQGALQSHGIESDLFYNVTDFTKKVAMIPCSAKTKQGIPELLMMLTGLSQKFLKERLILSEEAKGVVLEIKKNKGIDDIESILYDGTLKSNDEIAIATLSGEAVVTKIRSMEEMQSLSTKYKQVNKATAATGVKLHLTDKDNLVSGMPFQKINNNLNEIKRQFKKEISEALQTNTQGIIIKADSLGSLEALITLLKQENIQIIKAGIGAINKTDIISAKTNLEINPLDAIILGFNVETETDLEKPKNIKIITNPIVYKLIEDIQEFRKKKLAEMERERMLGLATITKLEILSQHVFRNQNPAVFGVKILGGKIKKQVELINEDDEKVARVKDLQLSNKSVDEAPEGEELAISLPGTNFERQLKETKYLYSNISASQFKNFKKNKDLLSASELKVLQEIAEIKRKKNEDWGL